MFFDSMLIRTSITCKVRLTVSQVAMSDTTSFRSNVDGLCVAYSTKGGTTLTENPLKACLIVRGLLKLLRVTRLVTLRKRVHKFIQFKLYSYINFKWS